MASGGKEEAVKIKKKEAPNEFAYERYYIEAGQHVRDRVFDRPGHLDLTHLCVVDSAYLTHAQPPLAGDLHLGTPPCRRWPR